VAGTSDLQVVAGHVEPLSSKIIIVVFIKEAVEYRYGVLIVAYY